MSHPDGVVYGLDHFRGILSISKKNIEKSYRNMLDSGKIVLIEGDGRNGLEEFAPFDVNIMLNLKGNTFRSRCQQ